MAGFDNFDNDNDINFGDDIFSDGFGDTDDLSSSQSQSAPGISFDSFDSFDSSDNSELNNDVSFNQMNNIDTSNVSENKTKKTAIITIACGVGGLILVIIIASIINKASDKRLTTEQKMLEQVQQTQSVQNSNVNSNINVDNIMGSTAVDEHSNTANSNLRTTEVINVVDESHTWTVIDENQIVNFNDAYTDMIFTVTGIQHKARAVDVNNNLVIKTTVSGSLSGLSGTYEIDVPYDKGTKLVVGNSFTVHVQLGTYSDKTVVGEIRY